MTRRTWLFLAAALLMVAALGSIGGAANAAFPTSAPSTSANASLAQKESGKPDAINCADIERLGIDKQMNQRAAEIMANCGRGKEVIPQAAVKGSGGDFSPDAYGGTDRNIHPSNSAFIQSETFSWRNANTIVVTYNDLSGGSTGKGSYSIDGGVTFARIPGDPFGIGHGSNFGDPTVVYDTVRNVWVANFLAGGCGGQGVGAWRSVDGITWTTAGCVNNSTSDDRNSAWSDTNVASPFHGRVYSTWNDFAIGGGALRSAFSNDGGLTWSAAVTVAGTFIRDVQLTGLPDGTLVLAGMNEGGGGAATRTNIFYRSTNGGASWTTVTANTFAPPGNANCAGNSYFRVISTGSSGLRHMGWGQPAGGPGNVVHYAYAQHGAGADEGDIYYIRSTNSGLTWSTPLIMNTDGGLRAQWMPSVAVTPGGAVFVQWYDRRDTANNDYWRYGRASLDNGVTWQTDQTVSDAVIPQPIVQTSNCYMGDYDYSHGHGTNVSGAWTDSRGAGSGGTQDAFFDTIPLIQGTPTPTVTGTLPTATPTRTSTRTPTITPTPCGAGANYSIATGTATIVAGTTNIGSFCDDCVVNVTLPFPFQLYDQTFTQVDLDSNGKAHFPTGASVFTNTCLPGAGMTYTIFPYWDDQRTDAVGSGIFTSVSGVAPNRIFNIEWRTTYFSGGQTANYELRLYEGLPGGNSRFDIIYGVVTQGITPATGGVQKNGTTFTQSFCNGTGLPITPNNLHAYSAPVTCGPTNTATSTPTSAATATCPPFAGNIASARNPVVVDGGVKPKNKGNTKPTGPNVAVVKGEPGQGPPAKLAPPAAPNVVLYDQYNNDGANAIVSANRSDIPSLSAQAADDFVVPAGQSWSINQVDARGWPTLPAQGSVNVYFYADAGTLPGAPVYTATNLTYAGDPDLLIPLTTPANLSSGSYWVSVQANMSGANWYWGMRSVQSNDPAAWREAGGYATGCNMPGWFNRGTCTGTTNVPDHMFRLNGTIDGGGGCPTATVTATTTPTACVRTLNGHLTYQGMPQPNAGNVQPITLQLQPTGGGLVSVYSTNTDPNGNFTVNLGPLAAGTYNWRLKSPRYLASSGTLTLTGACTITQEFGVQRAGDINNDNCVDITDFSLMRASFGLACGDPGYNPNAEYNGDCLVDITDFGLLRSNFGTCGAPEPARAQVPSSNK